MSSFLSGREWLQYDQIEVVDETDYESQYIDSIDNQGVDDYTLGIERGQALMELARQILTPEELTYLEAKYFTDPNKVLSAREMQPVTNKFFTLNARMIKRIMKKLAGITLEALDEHRRRRESR
jgi:hypothetical protein